MTPTKEQIIKALSQVRYPGTRQDIVSSGMLQEDLKIEGNKVFFSILFPKAHDPFSTSVVKAAEATLKSFVSEDLEVKGTPLFPEPTPEPKNMLQGVKNIVAIFSGKGGVGKSTVTANLAVALSLEGFKVGVLDADIHGPSMPKMFGVEGARPVAVSTENGAEAIAPIEVYNGIKLLSIGFFVEPDKALIWRGSMASNALTQLLTESAWGDLDYLLIDMPPGTSDIHLTLVQTVALTGVVVVTTPQEVALIDARKGIDMFTTDKVEVPVLGLIENMSWFTPAELPTNRYYIFGKEGGKKLAQEMGIPLLAELPLVQSICDSGDAGLPIASHSGSLLASYFKDLATKLHTEVEKRNREIPPSHKVEVVH